MTVTVNWLDLRNIVWQDIKISAASEYGILLLLEYLNYYVRDEIVILF